MEEERFSSRMITRQLENHLTEWIIPCDDATGGELHILQAGDGDLHVSMRYNAKHPNAMEDMAEMFTAGLVMTGVRIRSGPGGGSNSSLWIDLVKVLRKHAERLERKGGR